MKIDAIKILFAVAIGALLGYICKIIAIDENQWYSFAVAGITIIGGLIAAFATYSNVSSQRSSNTKVVAWVMAIVIVLANTVFAFTNYNHESYIVILSLLMVVDLFIVYILAKKR